MYGCGVGNYGSPVQQFVVLARLSGCIVSIGTRSRDHLGKRVLPMTRNRRASRYLNTRLLAV